MTGVKAIIHGAVSIVNAIATGKGSTLGISLTVETTIETSKGKGINIHSENKSLSSRLINRTVEKIVPKKELEKTRLDILLDSEIPTGYGLKSSSAISSSVALACAKLFKPEVVDSQVLLSGVDASIETKVSLTGAFDDACGCYYGGFVVTDNYKKKLIKAKKGPKDHFAIIFVPKDRKRGNVKNLKNLQSVFKRAWEFAKNQDYWNAMILNGYATSAVLNSDPTLISKLIENGAVGATVSGNGPAIAAICKKDKVAAVKGTFSQLEGRTIISEINNKKAEAHEV